MPTLPKEVRKSANIISHSEILARLPKVTGLSMVIVNQVVAAYFDQLHDWLRQGGEYYGAPLGLISTKVASSRWGKVRTVRFRASRPLKETVYKKLNTPEEVAEELAKHPQFKLRSTSLLARARAVERRGGKKGKA